MSISLPTRLSEDIKDVLTAAQKVTRKQPTDLDIALALVRSNRLYSRLDTLLKHLGIKPRQLEKALRRRKQQVSLHPRQYEITTGVLELAKEIAENDALVHHHHSARVDVEHVLTALSRSNMVSPVFAEFQLTEARIELSIDRLRGTQLKQGLLFFTREVVEVVLIVLFFLVVIKEGLGELRLIPSESMVPALQVDDRVVVEKVSRWFRPYERGDILVFYPPMTILRQDPLSLFLRATGFSGFLFKKEDNIDVAYIKRLIGMPGDMVEVRPGVGVYVNGKLLNEPYVNEIAQSCTAVQPAEICGPVRVPEGHYFMMGDNRNQSADSRYWGAEPVDRVVGRAVFRVWPIVPWRLGSL